MHDELLPAPTPELFRAIENCPKAPDGMSKRVELLLRIVSKIGADAHIQGPALLWFDASGRLRVLPIEDEIMLGRSEDCDVVLDDRLASRVHARLCPNGDAHLVEDLGSRNGTRLNGEILSRPRLLRHGDILCIGTTDFCYWEA
jgi:hypothetical protein